MRPGESGRFQIEIGAIRIRLRRPYDSWQLLSKGASFLIEWETSEKPAGYWYGKFFRYLDLLDSGRYEDAFGTRSLRVLVVVAAERGRKARLRRLADAADQAGATMVRVADWRELRAAPASDVLWSPLWTQPGNEDRVALFTETPSEQEAKE